MEIPKWFVETLQLRLQPLPRRSVSARRASLVCLGFAIALLSGPANLAHVLIQQTKTPSGQEANVPERSAKQADSKSNAYEVWQKIDLKIFSFYAPKDLVGGEVKTIDSGWEYKSQTMTLSIDAGIYSGIPTYEREMPGYHQKLISVDGAETLVWFYKDPKIEFRHVAGVHYGFKGLNEAITMELTFKESNYKGLAEQIFKSAKFQFDRTKTNRPERVAYPQQASIDSETSTDRGQSPIHDFCAPDKTLVDSSKTLSGNTVALRVLISPRGLIITVQPISGSPSLYSAAKREVRKMKLKPQRILGRSVETEIIIRLTFNAETKTAGLVR